MKPEDHQERTHIKKILTECQEHHNSKEEKRYIKQKNKQLKQVHHYLNTSLNLLSLAQDGISDKDPQESMRVTGFELPGELKRSRVKDLVDRIPSTSKQIPRLSLSRHFSSVSHKFAETKRKRSQERKASTERLTLPHLISRLQRSKQPANASRNSLLEYQDQRRGKQQQDVSYEHIKSQRRKVEQMRHLTVLGRVMGENYRKHIKKLEQRRKLFMRNKVHDSF